MEKVSDVVSDIWDLFLPEVDSDIEIECHIDRKVNGDAMKTHKGI